MFEFSFSENDTLDQRVGYDVAILSHPSSTVGMVLGEAFVRVSDDNRKAYLAVNNTYGDKNVLEGLLFDCVSRDDEAVPMFLWSGSDSDKGGDGVLEGSWVEVPASGISNKTPEDVADTLMYASRDLLDAAPVGSVFVAGVLRNAEKRRITVAQKHDDVHWLTGGVEPELSMKKLFSGESGEGFNWLAPETIPDEDFYQSAQSWPERIEAFADHRDSQDILDSMRPFCVKDDMEKNIVVLPALPDSDNNIQSVTTADEVKAEIKNSIG